MPCPADWPLQRHWRRRSSPPLAPALEHRRNTEPFPGGRCKKIPTLKSHSHIDLPNNYSHPKDETFSTQLNTKLFANLIHSWYLAPAIRVQITPKKRGGVLTNLLYYCATKRGCSTQGGTAPAPPGPLGPRPRRARRPAPPEPPRLGQPDWSPYQLVWWTPPPWWPLHPWASANIIEVNFTQPVTNNSAFTILYTQTNSGYLDTHKKNALIFLYLPRHIYLYHTQTSCANKTKIYFNSLNKVGLATHTGISLARPPKRHF